MSGKFPNFLDEPVSEVARKLLGCELESTIGGSVVRVRIVETESYDQDDEASHAFGGERPRSSTMFGPSGHLYVYFIYGMHHCCNIVTGLAGYGSGVLIRAVEPVKGLGVIKRRRATAGASMTNGPAKTCRALGIDIIMNGHDLKNSPLRLYRGSLRQDESVLVSQGIGISKAQSAYRRFYIKNNPYVSPVKMSAITLP